MPKRSPKRAKTAPKRLVVREKSNYRTPGRTDWKRVRRFTDAEIDRQIEADPNVAPEIDESWMRDAEIIVPRSKQGVYIRLDAEVLEYFKRQGPKYQTRLNAVLRAYVRARAVPKGR